MIARNSPLLRASKLAAKLAFALGLGLLATSVTADPTTGTRIDGGPATGTMVWSDVFSAPVKGGDAKAREANQRVRKIANCMATMHRKEAAAYLASSPQSANHVKIFAAFNDKMEDCLSYNMGLYSELQLQMPLVLIRGLIAEAFLHQWPKPSLVPKGAYRESYSAPWITEQPSIRVVEEMAFCMAEMHPSASIELLSSAFGSPAQSEAVAKVMALVPNCLQKDAILKTDATGLRAAIALGIYHRIVDRPPPNSATVGKS